MNIYYIQLSCQIIDSWKKNKKEQKNKNKNRARQVLVYVLFDRGRWYNSSTVVAAVRSNHSL